MGAPPKYKPEFCDVVIELGKQGKSITQMACSINVVKQTLYNWMDEYPDFLDAITRARQESQNWWESKGQDSLDNQNFQSSVYNRSMACRFPEDWRDNVGVDVTTKGNELQTVIVLPSKHDSD